MKHTFVTWVLLLLAFAGFSQQAAFNVLGTMTNPYSGPYALLTLDTLQEAKTLEDIYARYRSDWVARYISVAVSSSCEDVVKKAVGPDDRLTPEQMSILKMANFGCRIDVEVDYIPENNLKYNPPRKMNFSLTPVPLFEAKYPGGTEQLQTYLKENIIDKISGLTVEPIQLAKVRFLVNERGEVSDVQVFTPSGDAPTDKLILEAICNMPQWIPAKDSKGNQITQEFEFSTGTDLLRCDYQY